MDSLNLYFEFFTQEDRWLFESYSGYDSNPMYVWNSSSYWLIEDIKWFEDMNKSKPWINSKIINEWNINFL